MTANRDLKLIIRSRMSKTGESYSAARAQVLRDRLGSEDAAQIIPAPAEPLDVAVLKVGQSSARVRPLVGEVNPVTFRCSVASELIPGQVATILFERSWTHAGHPYASGKILGARIDIARLGLEPLPLEDSGPMNAREECEPYERSDPYFRLWRMITAKPRQAFEMHKIAWDARADVDDPDSAPVCDAAELFESGDTIGAHKLLMKVLAEDLRCIDAHGHLGNHVFDFSPQRAIRHYEIGVGIGELSLGKSFSGFLPWGMLYNRPFLRCLHGLGLCLWRLERSHEAEKIFERILWLNPNDNQGVRFCWSAVRRGIPWSPDDGFIDDVSVPAPAGLETVLH